MPLMREWTEITVDEELLIPVVRELLDMAANPNQVEIIHGTRGRVILAEAHLAEYWYQERLKRDTEKVVVPADVPSAPVATTKPVEPSKIVAADVPPAPPAVVKMPAVVTKQVEASKVAAADVSPPVKRVPAPKPSASPDGEES